jgi:uncharacterized protein YggL (DUF469 family)
MLGFTVTIALRGDPSATERQQVVGSLIELLERHDLTGAVRGDRKIDVIVRRDGSQATDADRALVRSWAEQWTARAEIRVGDIVDLTAGA